MKFRGLILLCCALLARGQEQVTVNDPDDTTTTAATTTSSSTTTKPTTTSEPPKTTTPTPSTTTTLKPTPTPTPTPVVPDYPKNDHKWSIEDKNNVSCIVLKCAMQILVLNDQNKTETVNIPPSAVATGSCNDSQSTQTLILTWNSVIPKNQNILTLIFEFNSSKKNSSDGGSGITSDKYALQDVDAVLYLPSENTTATHRSADAVAAFQTPLNHSYSCLAEEVVKSKAGDFTLKVRDVQLEAFRQTPSGHREFSAAVQCPADDATDVVPIAVGAALAGLVVIVLIAYLIGRKRSRARGYQSV